MSNWFDLKQTSQLSTQKRNCVLLRCLCSALLCSLSGTKKRRRMMHGCLTYLPGAIVFNSSFSLWRTRKSEMKRGVYSSYPDRAMDTRRKSSNESESFNTSQYYTPVKFCHFKIGLSLSLLFTKSAKASSNFICLNNRKFDRVMSFFLSLTFFSPELSNDFLPTDFWPSAILVLLKNNHLKS